MANEFPTLRLLAAVIDNGNDDTTPGELSNKLTELGCRLDDGVDRYSCAKLMSGGWDDAIGPYADKAWHYAITVTRALRSHHGYVMLESEEVNYLFRCHGWLKKPEPMLSFSTPRGVLWMEIPDGTGSWWKDTHDYDDDTGIPAPWALVVHDEHALHDK